MVSGWDKHPGPDNDYASPQWSKREAVIWICLIALALGLAVLLSVS